MIVPSMTDVEIKQEVTIDFLSFAYRVGNQLCFRYAKDRKKVDKTLTYPLAYKRISSRKNKWLFICNKAEEYNRYKGASTTSFACLTYFYNKKSFRVVKAMPSEYGTGIDGITIYNGHLFRRYAERTGLSFDKPLKVVKAFFTNNRAIVGRTIHNDHLLTVCKDGLVLGRYDRKNRIVTANTFVTKDQMFDNQTAIEKELIASMEKEIMELLNSPKFTKLDRLKYNYKTGVLLSLK